MYPSSTSAGITSGAAARLYDSARELQGDVRDEAVRCAYTIHSSLKNG
ncbi:hypothetical protein [Salibacterium sp. K-3]